MGAQFITVTLPIGENELQFDIWDTAGQERFKSLGALYYKTAKGALVVFDITAEKSFQRAKEWISELHQNAEPDILISLVGNKIDLESDRKVSREVGRSSPRKPRRMLPHKACCTSKSAL